MRSMRIAESNVLGYQIERVDEYDDVGLLRSMRHEVLCPQTGSVLASHTTRRAAERFVVARELQRPGAPLHELAA
jgi:hypothetical protein